MVKFSCTEKKKNKLRVEVDSRRAVQDDNVMQNLQYYTLRMILKLLEFIISLQLLQG